MPEIMCKIDDSELKRLILKYPEVSREVRRDKILEGLALLETAVKKGTPYGAGPIHLRDSLHHSVRVRGEKVTGVLGTPMEHGVPVEMGSKPHFPPIGPLEFWVEKKLGITDEKQARSVAYAIAWKIKRRGTKGKEMFKSGLEENEHRVMGILSGIGPEIVRRVGGRS
jgi:hypothetical protein